MNRNLKMTDERLKQLMEQVGMPNSRSLYDALRQAYMEGYQQLEAENKRLREALNAIAEGEIYPVQVALAALAATEPPIGDSGILDGSNRTTGGWIGQP